LARTKSITTVITDDIDGTPGAKNIVFSVGGHTFDIDLSPAHADAFAAAIAPYIAAARVGTRAAEPRTAETRDLGRQIRMWARNEGIGVADRGRIPRHVVTRYNRAHQDS
jgi:hypothetical protein